MKLPRSITIVDPSNFELVIHEGEDLTVSFLQKHWVIDEDEGVALSAGSGLEVEYCFANEDGDFPDLMERLGSKSTVHLLAFPAERHREGEVCPTTQKTTLNGDWHRFLQRMNQYKTFLRSGEYPQNVSSKNQKRNFRRLARKFVLEPNGDRLLRKVKYRVGGRKGPVFVCQVPVVTSQTEVSNFSFFVCLLLTGKASITVLKFKTVEECYRSLLSHTLRGSSCMRSKSYLQSRMRSMTPLNCVLKLLLMRS